MTCAEPRHSKAGASCGEKYYTCQGACPQDGDHRVKEAACGHTYAKRESPGHATSRTQCGSLGLTSRRPDGPVVKQVCEAMIFECRRSEHGGHTYKVLEFALGSVSEGYPCANPSCVYTDSESSGSNSSSSALPVEWSDTYRLALSARAWGALHWNHRVSLGIGAAPVGSGSPTLSYEHQRTCVGGHTYWSCDVSELILHGSRTCPTAGCGETYSDCLNTSGSCLAGGYHASAALSETLLELDSRLCPGGCGTPSADVAHLVEDCEGCGKAYYSCTQSGAHGICLLYTSDAADE